MAPKRALCVLLVALMVSGVAIGFGNVRAESSIPKPSVPEFTVKYVDLSYDVPSTTSIDQYTGKTVTAQGYHVENRTIQLTIRNQPFTSYMQDGQKVSFYYNVREKGQYSANTGNWITVYNPDTDFPTASKSDYTTLYYFIDGNGFPFWDHLLNGGTVDFQVQALVGSVHRISNITGGNQSPFEMFPWIFDGQTSDWSGTQTITIPASAASSPTSTPPQSQTTLETQPGTNAVVIQLNLLELVILVAVGAVVALLVVFIVLLRSRIRVLEMKQNGA